MTGTCDDHHAYCEHSFVISLCGDIAESNLKNAYTKRRLSGRGEDGKFDIVFVENYHIVEERMGIALFLHTVRTDVMHVIVKYSAVTYIVFFDGPLMISGVFVSFIHTYEYGLCVTFANFQSQLYCT